MDAPYAHEITLQNGERFREKAIGCKRRCLFCGYTWSRHTVTDKGSGDYNRTSVTETTLFDLDLNRPETWLAGNPYLIVGVDGMSERLRMLAGKPITNEMLGKLCAGIPAVQGVYRVKLFNIVGYPTETQADWQELITVICAAAKSERRRGRYCVIEIVSSHFDAMCCTPFATMPGRYADLRTSVRDAIRRDGGPWPHKLVDVGDLRVLWQCSVSTLPIVTLNWLMLRGTEGDTDVIEKIACAPAFWRADTATRRATVEKHIDVDRLFRAYGWDELPTRYLESWMPYPELAKIADMRLRKYGGPVGAKIADKVGGKG